MVPVMERIAMSGRLPRLQGCVKYVPGIHIARAVNCETTVRESRINGTGPLETVAVCKRLHDNDIGKGPLKDSPQNSEPLL